MIKDCRPWFNDDAIEVFQALLPKFKTAFEWGVGGTTAMMIKEGLDVTTIEHDPRWIREFRKTHPKAEIRNVALGASYPKQIASQKDIIIVDGRMRVPCFINAIKWVKPGGVLILDDSQRLRYNVALEQVPNNWHWVRVRGPGNGGTWETLFAHKPE